MINRFCKEYSILNTEAFKNKMLNWANQFSIFCFLDNHHYQSSYNSFECLFAVDVENSFELSSHNFLKANTFFKNSNDWLFGHVSFGIKNYFEKLESNHPDNIQFPELFFFQPKIVFILKDDIVTIQSVDNNCDEIFKSISQFQQAKSLLQNKVKIKSTFTKNEYISIVEKLKKHIQQGDCYEINFCQHFFDDEAIINPLEVYNSLSSISPNPFNCFYKLTDKYLLCASPERFIKKQNNKIISQPIKGTIKRSVNKIKDEELKLALSISKKNIAENVMVVDLVRNDFSKICNSNSVVVDELCKVYSFPKVHQLVSTISGELKKEIQFMDILKATFPMGSMTGAPKKRVMELIEQYEKIERGIFSGTIGYIGPNGNFDFNVVIRSIMYNSSKKYLQYLVGGGITFNSNSLDEYDESLLKASAINEVITNLK